MIIEQIIKYGVQEPLLEPFDVQLAASRCSIRPHDARRLLRDGRYTKPRLSYRDGKARYLEDTPRFVGYARTVAQRYAPLAPLARLLEELAPA